MNNNENTQNTPEGKKFSFTPAHEKFCSKFSECGKQIAAYLYAWPDSKYASARVQAHHLMQQPEIIDRIAELREQFAAKYEVSKEQFYKELYEAAEEARSNGQWIAYTKLTDQLIRLFGYYAPVQKHVDVTSKGEQIQINLNLGEEEEPEEPGEESQE